ncbi:MAG: OmpA family protein [bacterium]|nr:OmpA family protein [bacterium]
MENIKRYLGIIILLAVGGAAVYTFFVKQEEDRIITYSTSDAGNLKGDISIALDSWIGYFPFQSPVFGKLMRDAGYRLKIIDDKANYEERMKMLRKGKIDFAVCTIDSYLLNGESVNYPGAVIAVIDESKGGDAVVSWKHKVANIDQLKKKQDFKIAFTPASPSEHLLKSIAVHFGVSRLGNKTDTWRVEVDGAEDAYNKLIAKEVDIAAVWEPHVTEALSNPEIVKLIGSEDMERLIVDILLVNRKYAEKKPELVKLFLKNYFETINIYNASPRRLREDILSKVKLSKKQVKYMLKGVRWVNYPENRRWFGLNIGASHQQPELIESINSTVKILTESGDFSASPIPDNDPYTLVSSLFMREVYKSGTMQDTTQAASSIDSLTKKFGKLSEKEWKRLRVIGALKLRPISFRSGTSNLDENGRSQIKLIVDNVRHYPNFRLLIKGHTGTRGDQKANIDLSMSRAKAVKSDLQYSFNVDPNRIRVVGMGGKEPLPKGNDESARAFNNRLKRVEILFLSGKK